MKQKNVLFFMLALISVPIHSIDIHQKYFTKVIIWGHKLHSHTHSYIHESFYQAFKHLGYETHWVDNSDNVSSIDFSGALFITKVVLIPKCH